MKCGLLKVNSKKGREGEREGGWTEQSKETHTHTHTHYNVIPLIEYLISIFVVGFLLLEHKCQPNVPNQYMIQHQLLYHVQTCTCPNLWSFAAVSVTTYANLHIFSQAVILCTLYKKQC